MQTTKKEKQIHEEPKSFSRRRRTAVELAQLGEEGDSPQCGEMSRRDKREGHPLKWGQAVPLNRGFD